MRDGVLVSPPNGQRSSAGVTLDGTLDVRRDQVLRDLAWRRPASFAERVQQGAGKERDRALHVRLRGVDPADLRVVLGAALRLSRLDSRTPTSRRRSRAPRRTASVGIAPGTAVLVARGIAATKLQAEAPVGTIGGAQAHPPTRVGHGRRRDRRGPVLVRSGRPVYRANEAFETVAARTETSTKRGRSDGGRSHSPRRRRRSAVRATRSA